VRGGIPSTRVYVKNLLELMLSSWNTWRQSSWCWLCQGSSVCAHMLSSYLSYITDEEMRALAAAYPDDVTQVSGRVLWHSHYIYFSQGSPFNTGTANAKTFVLNLSMDFPFISTFSSPQYKRISAIQGDMFFQAPRRFLLEVASKTQPAYSYSKQTTSIIFLISWES